MAKVINRHQINLEQILNNSPDGVFTISPENEIRYVNPAFCRILGYTEDELLGSPIQEYLGDLDIFEACKKQVAEHGYCHDQETIFKRKDGSMVHISKNVQAIFDEQGNFREVLVTMRDLSELHQLNRELTDMLDDLRDTQTQLVEAEKMASLGGLVAGIAHEINTPLGISVTASSTMHRELAALRESYASNSLKKTDLEAFFEHAAQSCEILNTNLKRASELVRSFKQVAVDQSTDELRTINLKDYLNEVLVSIGPGYKHTGITLESECDSAIVLKTHPGALYQIISNLVINSVTHAYDSGDKGKIRIQFSRQGNNVVLEYSDDGKGISQEHLDDIFTPFFTTRRGMGGTGLGLSIVYNLVRSTLNGTIDVASKEAAGTTFKIVFPLSV